MAIKLTALGRPQFLVSARALTKVTWGRAKAVGDASVGQVLWGARLAAAASLQIAEGSGHQQTVPLVPKTTLKTLP